MIIPLHHSQVRIPRSQKSSLAPHGGLSRFEQQIGRITVIAAIGMRGFLLLLGVLMLRGNIAPLVSGGALAAALVLIVLTLGLSYAQWLTFPLALAADSIAVGLLLYGTGGNASPLFGLTLVLILQGALLGGGRDALAGGGASIVILLLLNLLNVGPRSAILVDLIALHLVGAVAAAWLCGYVRGALAGLRDDVARKEHGDQERERAHRTAEWLRLNLQVTCCTTLEALRQMAVDRATLVAGVAATVDLSSATQRAHLFQVPIACGGSTGSLTVACAPTELEQAQRTAIEHLAVLVGLRAAALSGTTDLQRQQEALMALWEISGVLRAALDLQAILRDACARLAAVLELDWMALLVPDERSVLVPLVLARGREGSDAPRLSGAQLRVAAEALRAGRSLVRCEGNETLTCLPIRLEQDAPLVLAARGAVADAATQTLLMLFGERVAERLALDAGAWDASVDQPVGCMAFALER